MTRGLILIVIGGLIFAWLVLSVARDMRRNRRGRHTVGKR